MKHDAKLMLELDHAWFRKNPHSNYRLRRPVEGELIEMLKKSIPAAMEAVEYNGGKLPSVAGAEWAVAIIKVSPETMMRMIISRPTGSIDKLSHDGQVGSGMVVLFGDRFLFDVVGA